MGNETKETGFIDRLVSEKRDLSDKIDKLAGFFESEMYPKLSLLEQSLLVKQHKSMVEYYSILATRLSLYENFTRKT